MCSNNTFLFKCGVIWRNDGVGILFSLRCSLLYAGLIMLVEIKHVLVHFCGSIFQNLAGALVLLY